jgi:segregation and condensation protein B
MNMEPNKLEMTLEALLFVSRTPIPTADLAKAAGVKPKEAADALASLRAFYSTRGVVLEEIAGGWQFRTHPSCASAIKEYLQTKPVRLTRQSIDTLSMIAYLQPVTKARIEEIRGVDTTGVLRFLMENGFIRIIGKKEEPGRPYLYGTTKYFLEFFGLKGLSDMPQLREQIELSEEELSGVAPPEEDPEEEEEGDESLGADRGDEGEFLDDLSSLLGRMKKQESTEGSEK